MQRHKTLFEIKQRPRETTPLTAFKRRHGILTWRSSQMTREEHPWLVLIPYKKDIGKDAGTVMMETGYRYEVSGRSATGEGELSAIRTLCEQMKIECDL